MLKKKLEFLRELEIVREQKKYNKKKLVANEKDCSNISNAIRVCTEQIEEILDEKIIENVKFSKKNYKDKQVAEFYYYFKFQPEFDENGIMRKYTWEDAFLAVYPAPYDDIDRDLTEAEEADCAKKLATKVDNCKHRISSAIDRYEKNYVENYLKRNEKNNFFQNIPSGYN